MLTLEREKEIREMDSVRYHLPTQELLAEIDALRAENAELKEKLAVAANDCKHPGCGCVCGHSGKCPEDGPCAVGYDKPHPWTQTLRDDAENS